MLIVVLKKNMRDKRKKVADKAVRLSAIDEDILTVLLGCELYGLEILDALNPERPISLSFGSLYPALNRLEKKGLISWRWGNAVEASAGARRKYYKVTGAGSHALHTVQQYRAVLSQRATQRQTALGGI